MLKEMSRHMVKVLSWLGFSRWTADTSGAIAVVFALCVPAFIGAAGVAVDLSQAYNVKVRLANALDKAALAAGSTDGNAAQIEDRVQRFFDANYPGEKLGTPYDLDVDLSVQGEVTVSAKSRVDTTFMNILGLDHLDVSVEATVKREIAGLEVVLVMDTTGSMGQTAGGTQTKIDAAKEAATALISTLYGTQSNVPTLWMGVVPFSQNVNIGTDNASWTSGSPDWGNGSWQGCVEARFSGNHDMDDTSPSSNPFPKYYAQCAGSTANSTSTNRWRDGTGADLIVNGNFAASTGWTLGNDWSIGSGILTKGMTDHIANGDFTSSTGWTLGTGWTVTGGVLSKTTTTTSSAVTRTTPSPAIVNGEQYVITYTIVTRTAGSVRPTVGSVNGTAQSVPGTYTQTITATANNVTVGLSTADGFKGTIDDITVKHTAASSTTSRSVTSLSSGSEYIVTYTLLSRTQGSVRVTSSGGQQSTAQTVPGTYTQKVSGWTGSTINLSTTNSFVGTIDNFSVIPVVYCGTMGTVTYQPFTQTLSPNQYCSQPMTPLSSHENVVQAGIDSMVALGGTQIPTGLSWGWRMLSPTWRGDWGGEMSANDLPLDYNTPTMNKVVILMTDGDNDMPNEPIYSAYGKLSDNRLGSASNEAVANATLNTKVSTLCTSMKSHNIIIYTIAFGTAISATSATMLRNCATKTSYYFASPTTDSIKAAFKEIASNLNSLHITH